MVDRPKWAFGIALCCLLDVEVAVLKSVLRGENRREEMDTRDEIEHIKSEIRKRKQMDAHKRRDIAD
jgi:hypothetical protein